MLYRHIRWLSDFLSAAQNCRQLMIARKMAQSQSTELQKIYVGNLSFAISREELAEFLNLSRGASGTSTGVEIVTRKNNNKPLGFGFVYVPSSMVDEVLKKHGSELEGRKLNIKLAKDEKGTRDTQEKAGRKKGGNTADSQTLSYRYPLVDIGANLTHRSFAKDVDGVIKKAQAAGVNKVMVTGISVPDSIKGLELVRRFPGALYCTAGVHPHNAKGATAHISEDLEELASNPECVAIGECGLDYNRNFSAQDIQREVFESQVQLACRLKKPLFVHEREAHSDMVDILGRYHGDLPPTVIHCFTGHKDEALKYIDMGFYIGLTGYLCKDRLDDGVLYLLKERLLPLERLLVETDAPFMMPKTNPLRQRESLIGLIDGSITAETLGIVRSVHGSRNEPCTLPLTIEIIAHCMGLPPLTVAEKTTANAIRLFDLK